MKTPTKAPVKPPKKVKDVAVPYVAPAVSFNGASFLKIAALATPDTSLFSMSVWLQYPTFGAYTYKTLFAHDPDYWWGNGGDFFNNPGSREGLSGQFISQNQAEYLNYQFMGGFPIGPWFNMLLTVDTNKPVGQKIIRCLINGTSMPNAPLDATPDKSGPFDMMYQGKGFIFSNDSPPAVFNVSDALFWHGVSFLDASGEIPAATVSLFRDSAGKPREPQFSIAAFGAPTIMFSGNSSTFGTNQGTAGAAVLTGTLTNAATSPSD
jgi:hypothetical protein